ncbi:MAG TPA: hypothetical protein VHL10_09525 [Nitrososphaera sp.]|nr:hypothetical protein [Nitrososphaera sp.]
MIARTDGTRMVGVYHHWDSYPSGVGAMLYKLYNGHFQRDSKAMLDVLVDQHPAGWSSINDADFSLAPGWSSFLYDGGTGKAFNRFEYERQLAAYEQTEQARRPHCYCHGERREAGRLLSSFADAANSGAEYAYVIDIHTDTMRISACSGNEWREIAQVVLYEAEPDWEKLNSK